MPELPEIETVRLQLEKYLLGQEIKRLERLHPKSVLGDVALVKNQKITAVARKGKMLILSLTGELEIAVHFKMSGQLVLVKSSKFPGPRKKYSASTLLGKNRIAGGHPTEDWLGNLPSKHTRAIFYLKSGDTLYFNDQRIFGWVEINSRFRDENSRKRKYIASLGPEPWDLTDEEFYQRISKRKKAIKLVLMDQSVVSGAGNIYVNDGLWEAGIHPQKQANSLDKAETRKLRAALIKILREGIKYGGATAADTKYLNLQGLGGKYQEHFRVYAREGQLCLRCNTKIQKMKLGGRGTYFCPNCQVK